MQLPSTDADTPVATHRHDAATELQALLDATVDGIVMIDHRGRIETFNRAAESLFGYEQRELLGRNVNVLMTDADRDDHDGYLARYAHTGVPHIIGVGREVTARRRDGTTFPAFLSVGRIGDRDPPRFVGFVQDVTVRQQALLAAERDRDQARQAQERLARVSQLTTLGEMAAGIAHELNQPLTAIVAYAQASQRLLEGPTQNAEVHGALEQISEQALRAGEAIRRLRALAGGRATRRDACDLNDVIHELVPLIDMDGRLHDVRISFDLTPEPLIAELDRVQLQQVLLNLLRNAIDALSTQPAGTRWIAIRTRESDGQAQLTVCDNGPGVDPRIVERMFHPFCTTKPSGTGLGLPISRTIVEAHGGKLEHVPDSSQGASFQVRLPLYRGASA